VRALEPGSPERVAEFSQPPPPARAVRLLARADTVALVVASAETYLLLSRDRGASFAPAVVAR
jgi:hypothetical protein